MVCWVSSATWGAIFAGASTLCAGFLCLKSQKSILVPRSLRPLVDGIPDGQEKDEVERATAMMMGIILSFLGILLLVTGIFLFVSTESAPLGDIPS